ncbi:TauD/TfdA dioxygenase family protein [Rhodococcus sp. NPDC060086]|uniref:TauD/TfdA dioxygenase family protein n=1 Tax=Rhodococcus sp. NPDC060086 TaxID=3347055 RepID=UPI003667DBED
MTDTSIGATVDSASEIYANGGITVRKVGHHLGAVIDGVEMSGDISDATSLAIRYALAVNKVIFFRSQHHLTDEIQYEFGARIGIPTTAHPSLNSDDSRTLVLEGAASGWHTDVTFVDRIPKASVLRSVKVPPYGGATTWASTTAAYEQLPDPLRVLVENLRAVHSNRFDYAAALAPEQLSGNYSKSKRDFRSGFATLTFETEHPVVRVHPETGERSLLLGHFVREFVGLKAAESSVLYQLLQNRVTKLENTVRWTWADGDVAIWDNRNTQHYGVADYGDHPRELRRTTLAGDVPVDVHGTASRIRAGDASSYSVVDNALRLPGFV